MRKASKRTVREVRIPIMRPLLDQFAQELQFSLMAARLGHFNKDNFDKIGASLNVIWGALFHKPPKDKSIVVVIEGAMRAMNQCGDRGDRVGIWTLTTTEQATVCAAADKAEEALQYLDVMLLYKSMQKLREMRIEERNAA